MFKKLLFFILVLGANSVFGQDFNLGFKLKTKKECSALGKHLSALYYMKPVSCELGAYRLVGNELLITTYYHPATGTDKFSAYYSVYTAVTKEPVKFRILPTSGALTRLPEIRAHFGESPLVVDGDQSDLNPVQPKPQAENKPVDQDNIDVNKFNNHGLLEKYIALETAEAAYKKFKSDNASKNYDISEVTTTDSSGNLVVSSDYKNSSGTDYVNSEELASLNKMNTEIALKKSDLDEYAKKTVYIGNGGKRQEVDLLIPDGDSYKINPLVKSRKISNDGTDEKRQGGDRTALDDATAKLIDFNKEKLLLANESVRVVKKAKKDKLNDLDVAVEVAATAEDSSRDAFKSDLDDLYVCKKERYQAQCLKKTSEVEKQCTEGAEGSDKDICKCDVTEEGSKLVPEKGETCDDFSTRVAQADEEVQEQRQYYAKTINDEDKTIDGDIDYEGGTGSIQELISENAKDLDMEYCEAFILDKNLIRSDDAGFSFVVLGTANQPMNDKPDAFDHPLQCTSSKSDQGSFDYEKMYGFYTDLEEDGYLSHLTQSGKIKLCVGLAYRENAVAKEILSSKLYSSAVPTDSIGTCNDILSAGKLVCSSSGQKSQVLSSEAYNELFITRNNSLTPEQKEAFIATGIEGFPGLKDSFISESQETDKYGSEETCERDVHEKFKQCMGMNYNKVSHLAKVSGDDPHFKSDSRIDSNAITERKANIGKEVYRQFGVCHAFKEIAKKVASDSDKWSGQETVSSLDGQYNCIKTTPFSLDFKACKRIVNTYNGFMVGDQARGIVNQGVTMAKTSNIRRDATSQMASGDQLNAGLDAQKKTYEMQRDQERGNLAFFGVQAATFTAMLTSYPTPNKISKKCGGDTEIDSGNFCKAVMVWNNDEQIRDGEVFPNQETKKKMWMEVMKAASSATLAAIKQGQFNKMAGDIKKIKDAFGNLSDKSTTKDSQIELSYCKFNPTAPTCRTSGPRVTRGGGFQYGNISTQGAGGAVNIAGNNAAFGEYDEGEDSAAKRAAIQDLGGMIDNTSADSFNNNFDKIGAGSFAKKGLGGGGGGGGGAAGGGGGGGGGAGPAKAGDQNKFAVSKSGGTGRFQSGTGGKSGFGSGGSSSKKSASKNPFSNMFGSKKGRNVASQGNNDIAPANSALFDKISKRYSKVAAENRLINLQGLTK